MKMDVTLFFLAFTMFWKSSQSVKCFKCKPTKQMYDTTPACTHFNHSEIFMVECDTSTMCFKRETTLQLNDGEQYVTLERGCASQTMEGDQRKVNGKWRQVKEVYDVYEESCKEHPSDYERPTKTVHCYCRGDLCNDAAKTRGALGLMFTVVLWLLVND